MKARIVIGANYGDEGKGTIVARLTKESTSVLNVLTNGGSQRGHSILTKDGSMTFQHFGSGTYHGADNYYSAWYILNPMQFFKEYCGLIVKPKHIYRDSRCRWSTPYDVMANLIDEEQRGRKASCGMGIWMTIQRYGRDEFIPFDDFMAMSEPSIYLNAVRLYYEGFISIPERWREIWHSTYLQEHFVNDCRFMAQHTEVAELSGLDYEDLIFENGQGLLLSDTGKDTADTTPSITGIDYALNMVKYLNVKDVTAHYVTRPYLTRHGDGDIMFEQPRKSLSADINEDRTNHRNDHQGAFRYGKLDIPDLHQRVSLDSRGVQFELDVTHCDEMDRESSFRRFFSNVNFFDTADV